MNNEIDTGGQAFPTTTYTTTNRGNLDIAIKGGMTLRDHFAGLSMQASISTSINIPMSEIAKIAYEDADAMIEARKNQS